MVAGALALGAPVGARADGWAVIANLAGRGDLAQDVQLHASALRELRPPTRYVLQATGAEAEGARWWWQGLEAGMRPGSGPVGTSVAGRALGWRDLLLRARPAWEDRSRLVLLLGHGLPPEADGERTGHGWRAFVEEGPGHSRGMAAARLAGGLGEGLRGSQRPSVDLLVLEACYSASLEALAEVAPWARFVVVVPGEVVSPGIAWGDVASWLNAQPERSPEALGRQVLAATAAPGRRQALLPWSLTLVDLSRMPAVLEALAEVSREAAENPIVFGDAARWAQARSGVGEKLAPACDVADLARALSAYGAGTPLEGAAERLGRAAERLVRARASLGEAPESVREQTRGRLGITLFVPPLTARGVEGYLADTPLAARTGYDRALREYVKHCATLSPFRL